MSQAVPKEVKSMYASIADIIVHVDESLESEEMHNLEDAIRLNDGVVSVGANERTSHLLMVLYNSEVVCSSSILGSIKSKGLHAELVGI